MEDKHDNFFKVSYRLLDIDSKNLPNLKLKDFLEPFGEVKAILKVLSKRKLITFKKGVIILRHPVDKPIIESVDKKALSKYLLEQKKGYSDFLLGSDLPEDEIKNILKYAIISIGRKTLTFGAPQIINKSLILTPEALLLFKRIANGTNNSLVSISDNSEESYDHYEKNNVYYVHKVFIAEILDRKGFSDFVSSSRFNSIASNEIIRWVCGDCNHFLDECLKEKIEKYLSDFKIKKYKICKYCKAKNYFRVYKSGKIKFLLKK